MARGTQLISLVTMLRAELRRSVNPSVGVEDLYELKQVLNRNYQTLWWAHDWPHLCRFFAPIALAAGQQFYDMPTGLGYERIKAAAVRFSGQYQAVTRGISFPQYAISDPADANTSDPILNWDVRFGNGVSEQIEVWPVPASNLQALRFFGYATDPKLVNDADLCLIDDNLLVLTCAAEILTGTKSADATLKGQLAQSLLAMITARTATRSPPVRIGQSPETNMANTRTTVRIAGR